MKAERYDTWELAGIRLSSQRQHKQHCPKCGGKSCLSVRPEKGFFRCHRPICEWKGRIGEWKPNQKTNTEWKPLADKTTALVQDDNQGWGKIVKWLHEERKLPLSVILNNPDLAAEERTFNIDGQWVKRKCVAFRYLDDDALMMCKFRSGGKDMNAYAGGTPILYRLNAIKHADEVILTEGEIDALSFVTAGFDNAASIPNGASEREMKWIDNCAEWLDLKDRFYLALDLDVHGRAATEEVARRLGKHRCWLVDFPDGCKDANETLIKQGAEALRLAIANARPYPIRGINTYDSIIDRLEDILVNGFPQGADTGTQLDEVLMFHPGSLIVYTGHANHGKSPFVSNIMCWLALKHGHKWGVFSPEYKDFSIYGIHLAEIIVGKWLPNTPKKPSLTRVMTREELQEAGRFLDNHVCEIRPEDGEFSVDALFELARTLVAERGIQHLVIDHWKKIKLPEGEQQRTFIRNMLNELKAMAVELSITTHLVAHPLSKQLTHFNDSPNLKPITSLTQVSESDDFYNLADIGVVVSRIYEEMLSATGNRIDLKTTVEIVKMKNKWEGRLGRQDWHHDPVCSRYNSLGSPLDMSFWRSKDAITLELREEINGFWDEIEAKNPVLAKAPF